MSFNVTDMNKPKTKDVEIRVERKVIGVIELLAKLKGKSTSEITAQALIEYLEEVSRYFDPMDNAPASENPVLPLKCKARRPAGEKCPPPGKTPCGKDSKEPRKQGAKASATKKIPAAKLKISPENR